MIFRSAASEAGVPPRPRTVGLTVIVPAYSRTEFLPGAVRSLLAQRAGVAWPVEILVVKNFASPGLEDLVRSESVATLEFGSRVYGSTIARAIRASRGKVIAFLEDDDLFDPTKLARLEAVFAKEPSVTFYHNDYREIDRAGGPSRPSAQRRGIDRRVRGRGLERYAGAEKVRAFDRIGDSVPSAHLSCIAMRREALTRVLDRLERVPIGVDFFLFFVALASEGEIVIDPEKLTLYRRHPGNSSRSLSFDPAWYGELVEGSRRMAEETRGMVDDLGRRELHPILDGELAAHALYVATSAPVPRRRAVGSALLELLGRTQTLHGVGRKGLCGEGALFSLSPSIAARLLRPRSVSSAGTRKVG